MKTKIASASIIALLALIVLTFTIHRNKEQKSENSGEVTVGAVFPLTGDYAAYGKEFQRGAQLAENELNKDRSEQKRVRVIFEDNKLSNPQQSVGAVQKLLSVDKANIVLLTSTVDAAPTAKLFEEAHVPAIVLWDSNERIEDMGDYMFAVGPWTASSGEVAARFAYENNYQHAAVLLSNNEWSVTVSDGFVKKFKELGGVVALQDTDNSNSKDVKTLLQKVISEKIDIIYATADNFNQIVKQSKELGFNGIIITSDILDSDTVAQDPITFEGVFGTQAADPETNETSAYVAAYTNLFHESPKKVIVGAWAYDAVKIAAQAVQDSADGSKAIKNLYGMKPYSGASGTIKFNEKGSSKVIPKMFVVKNGEIVLVK